MATAEQEVAIKEVVVKEPKPLRAGYWDQWIGKQMVFQTKGRATITGVLKEFRNMFLAVESATITGTRFTAKPKVVLVDRNYISHFHEVCELEETNGNSAG